MLTKSKSTQKTVSQVVNDLINHMRRTGGSEIYLDRQEKILKRFLRFASENRLLNTTFCLSIVERYLQECGIPSFEIVPGQRTASRKIQTAMRKLIDFHRDGYVIRRRLGTTQLQVPETFKDIHQQYIRYRIDEKEIGPRTMRLSVRETAKFLAVLAEYNQSSPDNTVFPGPCGKECNNRTLYSWFRNALFDAGIPHGGRGKGPRLHDLRHTFAVHNLERWIKEKQDLQVNLSVLVDYLGHENMSGTGQYLRLVPSIYPEIVARMEDSVGRKIKRLRNETD
jgi:integrase